MEKFGILVSILISQIPTANSPNIDNLYYAWCIQSGGALSYGCDIRDGSYSHTFSFSPRPDFDNHAFYVGFEGDAYSLQYSRFVSISYGNILSGY